MSPEPSATLSYGLPMLDPAAFAASGGGPSIWPSEKWGIGMSRTVEYLVERKYFVSLLLAVLVTAGVFGVAIAQEADAGPTYDDLGLIGRFFLLLKDQPFLYLFLALALGYPLGRLSAMGVNLGATAGTLVVGIVLANIAFLGFDVRFSIPGILSTVFLMIFMYAIGLRVGPQFFSGLARDGGGLVVIAVIIVVFNWIIAFGGAQLVGLAPGYGPGLISGSFTVTAVIGVAQSAFGAWSPPEGITLDQVGANLAAGYAVSYILSSLLIILLIRYLPSMFGYDPVEWGKKAEEEYGAGIDDAAPPGTDFAFKMGYSPLDVRAYKVENKEIFGRKPSEIFRETDVPILRLMHNGVWKDVEDDEPLAEGDVITVRADVEQHITRGREAVGPEVSDKESRNIQIEVAEIVIGKSEFAGKSLRDLAGQVGYGLALNNLFRGGQEIPHLPDTVIEVGDVARIAGPTWAVDRAAEKLGGKVVRATTETEVTSMAIALFIGFAVGIISIPIGGIPFALGTSAGCILAGIVMSTLRTRNPTFGGPVSEGARSLLQGLGLNMFIAVLAANVGPKVVDSFSDPAVVLWLAVFGSLAATVPAFLAWLFGLYILKMNPIVLAGACAGGRNSTPAMNAIQDQSKSFTPAIGYPVPYAVSTILVLIGGYLAMVLS